MTQQLPTGLTLAQINSPTPASDWNNTELAVANTLGLPTTSWGPGAVERTIFAVLANMLQQGDVAGSMAIQAGFVNFAAFGTVSWIDSTGNQQTAFVTPDPSIPAQNPTGALGWLDVLADGAYNVQRILQGPAAGALSIINTQATTYGPFAAGSYTVSQPGVTGAPTYTNAGSFSIPASTILGTVTGTSNSSGNIRIAVGPGPFSVGQIVFVSGVGGTTEANGAWTISATDGATYIVLSGSTFTNAWTSGGAVYIPTLANFQATSQGSASSAQPNTVNHSVTSLIGVSVDNYSVWSGTDTEGNASVANRCNLKLQSISPNGPLGAYTYYALTSVQLGPKVNPPVSVSNPITRVLTQKKAGVVTVTIGNNAGAPSSTDVTAVDAVIQAFCVPAGTSELTQASTNLNVTVLATIWVPNAFTGTVGPIAQTAVQTYLRALSPGGISDPTGSSNIVPIEGVKGAIQVACSAASIPVQDLHMTLNGASTDLSVPLTPTPNIAIFANFATFVAGTDLTVVGF